jgi:type IV secretion system protein VirB10
MAAEPELGRGLPSINALAAWPQRLSRLLALALMGAIGSAILITYYVHAFAHRKPVAPQAVVHAAGDMPLPPLPKVVSTARAPETTPYVIGSVVGEPPPLGSLSGSDLIGSTGPAGNEPNAPSALPPPDRRLTGAVFEGAGGAADSLAMPVAGEGAVPMTEATGSRVASGLSAGYQTAVTPVASARRLPTRHLWLPRGASLDCTLVTAIDSSLPGLVTCLTAADTFGADGTVVLLERGTTLVGETRGEVRAGLVRIGIVWTEARTPGGVVVPLDSPATDALGRAGVDGQVERHFWERFGAAMLLSVIDGALQSQSAHGDGTTIVYGGGASSGVIEEVLKGTVAIPPTVRVAAGTRVQALVARDIDFRGVYELRLAHEH